jgi:hypothetical protein
MRFISILSFVIAVAANPIPYAASKAEPAPIAIAEPQSGGHQTCVMIVLSKPDSKLIKNSDQPTKPLGGGSTPSGRDDAKAYEDMKHLAQIIYGCTKNQSITCNVGGCGCGGPL